MRSKFHIPLLMTSVVLILGACRGEDNTDAGPTYEDNGKIFAGCEKIRAAEGIDTDDPNTGELLIQDEFSSGDILYFSQMPQGGSPNFADLTSTTNRCYIYEYQTGSQATWAEGYNFSVTSNSEKFTWDNVIAVGPDGNTFKFFGFFFPVDQTPIWRVQTTQTGPGNRGSDEFYDTDNFMKSDIMGAYHATSAIFTRMRFRLFHLMTYLKVTLYVPVFKGSVEDGDMSYSGFDPGALLGGYVMNATTNFSIEWAAAKSSDSDAPLVQPTTNAPKANIRMYEHRPDENYISELSVSDFMDSKTMQTVEGLIDGKDEVRTYEFSVLFPTQTFGDNFLCFGLKTPGGSTKYYYFSASQIVIKDHELLALTPGTLQQLYLYVPRKTNQTILVGAKILPWNNAETEMTVTKKQND